MFSRNLHPSKPEQLDGPAHFTAPALSKSVPWVSVSIFTEINVNRQAIAMYIEMYIVPTSLQSAVAQSILWLI
jgi:hypothetical protein|tara:strand:- start:78 stop:296 length:219 start_codon:yes stop_codon:yes gene_type:complete